MATSYSKPLTKLEKFQEMDQIWRSIMRLMRLYYRQSVQIRNIEAITEDEYLTSMQEMLDDVTDQAALLSDVITNHWSYDHPPMAWIRSSYASADIDVDNGASKGVITAVGGTPFSVFTAGDYVTIETCEDSDTNGDYIIDTVTDTVMTLTTVLGGSDESDDESIFIWCYYRP